MRGVAINAEHFKILPRRERVKFSNKKKSNEKEFSTMNQ